MKIFNVISGGGGSVINTLPINVFGYDPNEGEGININLLTADQELINTTIGMDVESFVEKAFSEDNIITINISGTYQDLDFTGSFILGYGVTRRENSLNYNYEGYIADSGAFFFEVNIEKTNDEITKFEIIVSPI